MGSKSSAVECHSISCDIDFKEREINHGQTGK